MKLPLENFVQATMNTRTIKSAVNLPTIVTMILLLPCYNETKSDMIAQKKSSIYIHIQKHV